MYAVTGVTGQVGSAVARKLPAAGEDIRVVVRSTDKSLDWSRVGCEVAVADIGDTAAVAKALANIDGAFVLLPSRFDPSPDFSEPRSLIAASANASHEARPAKTVFLSTIGFEAERPSLLQPLRRYLLCQRMGRVVRVQDVARDQWESLFIALGMKNPLPRMQMLDGFNRGWLKLETTPIGAW